MSLCRGIWTRDIKISTNIQQQVLAKTLKILETRNLIKSVRSVISKSKKLYMLFDLEPAKEISGGAWYTDQEFDHEFIEFVSKEIISHVKAKEVADILTIADKIKVSGISKVSF
jgi:DNA-directed RNA polymerase III subunit RPC6